MINKNVYIIKLLKEDAIRNNNPFYFVRKGFCDYKKCQSACCRFTHIGKNADYKKNYYNLGQFCDKQGVQIRNVNGIDHFIVPRLCNHISFDGKCELHNKRNQPRICKYFPMHPTDSTYIILKNICGYKFYKVKNLKYKMKKK